MKNRQHLRVSKEILNDKELTTNDIGVYLAIGKYMNSDKIAFPSQMTLVKDTELSLQTIRNCIKHLESRNAFIIEREGRKNIYKFSPNESYEKFDYEFINKQDLSTSEKGFVAKIQPYIFKDGNKGVIKYTYSELQDKTGLSVSTILRNSKSLEKKDYATIEIDKKTYHLDKLGQFVLCTLKDHEERLQSHDKELLELRKEISKLKKQLNLQQESEITL